MRRRFRRVANHYYAVAVFGKTAEPEPNTKIPHHLYSSSIFLTVNNPKVILKVELFGDTKPLAIIVNNTDEI